MLKLAVKFFYTISGRTLLLFFGMLLIGGLASCTPNAPNETGSVTLESAPDTLRLTSQAESASSLLHLSCGCGFLFTTTAFGDTSIIRFAVPGAQLQSNQTNSYAIGVSVSGAPANGIYSSWVAFETYDASDSREDYDTLHVILTIP